MPYSSCKTSTASTTSTQATAEAAAGKLSKEQFITRVASIESRAGEKTRAFYLRVFLPWAKEHHVATDPLLWFVASARPGVDRHAFAG